jgi:hypothetical protein
MANSRFYQFLYSKDAMLTRISGTFVVGSDGSVTSFTGKGIEGIHARPGATPAGVYYVELDENYNALVGFDWWVSQGLTGGTVTAGSFSTGTAYQITSVGNTDWGAIGFYSEDYTAAVGMPFIATGAGSGTGTGKALVSSGICNIELLCPQSLLQNTMVGDGSTFVIKCYDYSGTAAFPADTTTVTVDFYLRNSTVAY